MLAQVRIYTINRGQLDAFLAHFKEETMPLHEKVGIPILGTGSIARRMSSSG